MAKDKSPKVHQRDKFQLEIPLRPLPWTENQKEIVNTVLDKNSKIIFIAGPAGSGKSAIATYCGLRLISEKKLSDYVYIRNPLESSDSAQLGFIPGDLSEKFEPYVQIFNEKAEELTNPQSIRRLNDDNRLHFIPVNYIRGSTMAVKFIHVEECNNFTLGEYKLLLTRYGEFSKLIFVGDFDQTDLPISKRGAFRRIFNLFNNETSREKGIHCFELQSVDIKRSTITSYVIDTLQNFNVKD
jgi:phosphate starvation-inducible PhoH-like protein